MARKDGVPPKKLEDVELRNELKQLYRTRQETFLNSTKRALEEHTKRMLDLEKEFRRRFPRETRPAAARTRAGARAHRAVRGTKPRTQRSIARAAR